MVGVFNLSIPIPNFINDLSPQLAREAMQQISNAQRIHKLHMAISSATTIGSTGVVGFLVWNRELTTEDRRLEEQKRDGWVFWLARRAHKLSPKEDLFSCVAIIVSITASIIFFSNFMGYRSLQNLRTLHFPKLEKIATIQ